MTPLTPSELAAIGQALYGDNWIKDMAKALDYNHTTVWRWSKGAITPSRKAAKAVRALGEAGKPFT